MGLSSGWEDIYPFKLPGQSVDVTDIPDGKYRLWVEADETGWFREATRDNNVTWVDLELVDKVDGSRFAARDRDGPTARALIRPSCAAIVDSSRPAEPTIPIEALHGGSRSNRSEGGGMRKVLLLARRWSRRWRSRRRPSRPTSTTQIENCACEVTAASLALRATTRPTARRRARSDASSCTASTIVVDAGHGDRERQGRCTGRRRSAGQRSIEREHDAAPGKLVLSDLLQEGRRRRSSSRDVDRTFEGAPQRAPFARDQPGRPSSSSIESSTTSASASASAGGG